MNGQRAPRQRETFLVLFLAIALAFAVMLFTLMISGRYFFAILTVVAGMIVLGFIQYLLWGWPMERTGGPRERETTHLPQ